MVFPYLIKHSVSYESFNGAALSVYRLAFFNCCQGRYYGRPETGYRNPFQNCAPILYIISWILYYTANLNHDKTGHGGTQ